MSSGTCCCGDGEWPRRLRAGAVRAGRPLVAALLAMSLAGCGGGGGGSAPPDAPPGLRFADTFSHNHTGRGFTTFPEAAVTDAASEFRFTRQFGNYVHGGPAYFPDTIGLAYARALGLSGRGAKVAVVDDGFQTTHTTFRDTTIIASPRLPVRDHGTAVAGRLAGADHGVAPGAALYLYEYGLPLRDEAASMDAARTAGVRISNNAWIYAGTNATRLARSESSDPLHVRLRTQIGDSDGARREYVDAIRRFAERGVFVFALDNNPLSLRVPLPAGLPMLDPDLTRAWIAVTDAAVRVPRDPLTGLALRDTNGRVAIERVQLLSQPCLEIAHTCLVTEATGITAASGGNSDEALRRGSSMATAQVSGALAILAEAFPGAHIHDLRRRLLASANDGFFRPDGAVDFGSGVIKGYSRDYGHGVLDLRAALMPIGRTGFRMTDLPRAAQTATAAGDTLPNGEASLLPMAAAVMAAGPPMGDALRDGLKRRAFTVHDALGGRFRLDGAALAPARQARRDGGAAGDAVRRFLQQPGAAGGVMAARDLGFQMGRPPVQAAAAAGAGAAGATLMADGWATALSAMPGGREPRPAEAVLYVMADDTSERAGLAASRRVALRPGFDLFLGGSLLRESHSLLGLHTGLRETAPAGRSAAVSLTAAFDAAALAGEGRLEPGRATFTVSAEVGATAASRLGVIGEVEATTFSSMRAGIDFASLLRSGDRLSLSASQPVRIESGGLLLALPRDDAGEERSGRADRVSLAPSGRQLDLAVSYSADLLGNGASASQPTLRAMMGTALNLDHGHRAGAKGAAAFAALALRF